MIVVVMMLVRICGTVVLTLLSLSEDAFVTQELMEGLSSCRLVSSERYGVHSHCE